MTPTKEPSPLKSRAFCHTSRTSAAKASNVAVVLLPSLASRAPPHEYRPRLNLVEVHGLLARKSIEVGGSEIAPVLFAAEPLGQGISPQVGEQQLAPGDGRYGWPTPLHLAIHALEVFLELLQLLASITEDVVRRVLVEEEAVLED